MEEIQNANPVILDASDLPSRHSGHSAKIREDGGTGLFDSLLLPTIDPYDPSFFVSPPSSEALSDEDTEEEIDAQEIYDLISTISDPEHPLSLGSLAVVNLPDIHVSPPSTPRGIATVRVELTPTVNHCSLATVIGLGVRVRLEQALSPRFRVLVQLKKGTHSTVEAVNKQLADKERVVAALENGTLLGVIRSMLATCN